MTGESNSALYLIASEAKASLGQSPAPAPSMIPLSATALPDGNVAVTFDNGVTQSVTPDVAASFGFIKNLLPIGGAVIGGILGGPGGATAGYTIGGAISGAGGGGQTPGIIAGGFGEGTSTGGASGFLNQYGDLLGDILTGGIGGATAGGSLPVTIPGGTNLNDLAEILLGAAGGSAQGNTYGDVQEPYNPPVYTPAPTGASNAVMSAPGKQVRLKAPRGYVIVEVRPGEPFYAEASKVGQVSERGFKVAMRKETARKYGLWKPQPKPLLTRSEMRTIRKANTLKRKVASTAQAAGVEGCKMPPKPRRR